ncbi:hypothetical protein VN24_15930 [Paenibacillus beijingensis]|uniref:histidine kinase n=2 Tax=Paenibacillus beijingensis TaxID=1126833 RepID=A0A0D5NSB1_9BACL|nr:hypothetical protein VN24_15930 [Paenibacillus beijingensis]
MRSGWTYVLDRLFYIVSFLAAIGVGCLIWILDRTAAGSGYYGWTLLYFVLLSVFALVLFLAADYARHKRYLRQLQAALAQAGDPQALQQLNAGVTREQRAVQELLAARHLAYHNALDAYKKRQEFHHHFIHQWVHQMKTPVSVIDLIAQQESGGGLSGAEAKALLLSVGEEAERLARGLEQMLNTARLDKFELDLHPKRLALHEAARSCINTHKRLLIRGSIFPQVEGEAWAETDEKWLAFILNQLIANAIKYSRPKPGSKRLTVKVGHALNGVATVTVQDEGIGIPSQDLPRVFDPFFTGENGRSSEESTGMGLYLVQQVCLKLGHRIRIESAEGRGTAVTVEISGGGIHGMAREMQTFAEER